jgi:SpoVK/Ycf46/Vps4 family AAA+-type ATPase
MSTARRRGRGSATGVRSKELSQEPIFGHRQHAKDEACDEDGHAEQPGPYKSDLEYLQDELDWVEERTRRIFDEVALVRVDAGEEVDDFSGKGMYDETPPPRVLRARAQKHRNLENAIRATIDYRLEETRRTGVFLALDRLCTSHALDDFDRTVMLLAAAPCFSRRFEELLGALDREKASSGASVEVIFAFCEKSMEERIRLRRRFSPKAPLFARDLARLDMGHRYDNPKDLLIAEVALTDRTFNFLVGDESLSDEFLEFSSVEEPKVTLDQVVLPVGDKQRILSVVERHQRYLDCRRSWGFDDLIRYGRGVLMLFHGKPGTGKTMMAHAVAARMGKRILNVDIPAFLDKREADRFLPGLFREARLQDALLFFDECELLFGERRFGNAVMTMLLTELERFEGVAVLATNLPQILDEALDRRILVKVRFPEPDRDARREIWSKHLPSTAPIAGDVDLDLLADRFEMAGGYIKNAVLMAVAEAVHTNGDSPIITMAHLEKAARDQLRRPLDADSPLVMPKVRLSDVILSDHLRSQIKEVISAARNRRTVLERWGIGAHLTYGKGVSALFYGPPGTGKTLCAEAIACELNQPLQVVAIPAVVSKWVGQTEQNLARLFSEARTGNAVLFLDEADTLLMERGEGRASRHDDSVVNTLLTLIERHDGVVLLATNLPDRLDKALVRRLTYRLGFPFPEAEQRAAIWKRLVPATVPTAGEIDFARLGRDYCLSGGHIKNAVFKAAFRAARADGPLTQALLEEAAMEEGDSVEGIAGKRRAVGFSTK